MKTISPRRGGEEQRLLVARRQVRANDLERIPHLVEAGMQARDREVAREHRPLKTEASDAVAYHGREAVQRPVVIVGYEVRDLDPHIGVSGKRRKPVAPSLHAFRRAVDGLPQWLRTKI